MSEAVLGPDPFIDLHLRLLFGPGGSPQWREWRLAGIATAVDRHAGRRAGRCAGRPGPAGAARAVAADALDAPASGPGHRAGGPAAGARGVPALPVPVRQGLRAGPPTPRRQALPQPPPLHAALCGRRIAGDSPRSERQVGVAGPGWGVRGAGERVRRWGGGAGRGRGRLTRGHTGRQHEPIGPSRRSTRPAADQWVRPTPSWQWGPPQCSTILPSWMRSMAVPLISTDWPEAPTP
jgi:hypothetical protein